MRYKVFAAIILVLLVLLSACSPQGLQFPSATPFTPTPSVTETPTEETMQIPPALKPAISSLAGKLGIPADQIELKSYQPVDWPDSCLGAAQPGEICLQVITPGYKALFSTPQGEVEVHTNKSGDTFRIVTPLNKSFPTPSVEQPALVWQHTGGIAGVCYIMNVDVKGSYRIEDCKNNNPPVVGDVPSDQMAQIMDWSSRYQKFYWESTPPSGAADVFQDSYTFYGQGTQSPTPDEQAEINQFLTSLSSSILARSTPPTGGGAASGIQGQVLIGPTCPGPVPAEGTACPDKPYQTTVTILDQNHQPVKQIRTDEQGRFKVDLPPGTYILQPEKKGLPSAGEQTIEVQSGQYTQTTITYDSGIR
jgi:hypothetical protein